jgi:hypothetical protein
MRAVPRLCIVYPGICLKTEENHGKPQSECPKAVRLISAESDSFSRLGDHGRWPRLACRPLPVPAGPCHPWLSHQATGSTLGQLKYLPSCRTRGFPTSANFDSKLAVRALMWSANNGSHRSSRICLLLTYQEVPIGRRRTWIVTPAASRHGSGQRTATWGTRNPSWGG